MKAGFMGWRQEAPYCILSFKLNRSRGKMNKCPRCKLPQEGMYRCQYCGYKLPQGRRGHIKLTRKKLNNLITKVKIEHTVHEKILNAWQSINHSERGFKMK